jgi:hypothetical protein
MSTPVAVNEHYLDHVVALSESSDVEASEDIVSGTGLKLMAKGSKIDARARERLLQHKLTKPLESMMRVVDGVATRQIDRVADALLSRHPLLSRLCGGGSAWQLTSSMRNVTLSPQVESLLSVYASQAAGKLEHAVGIALLGAALAQDLPTPTDPVVLMIAGLVHDAGELYIDPAFLAPGAELTPQQWKHIASHPIVGSRVLAEMPGAGPQVAQAVLHHHERHNGFGYPQGTHGDYIPLAGQALAVAEMLMGVMEGGGHHADRAAVAMRLVPGEFSRPMLDRVMQAARAARSADEPLPTIRLQDLIERLASLTAQAQRFGAIRAQWLPELPSHAKAVRDVLTHVLERFERIRVAFSSTGLDGLAGNDLLKHLEAMTPAEQLETSLVLRELQWRMRELERQATIRSEGFSPQDAGHVRKLLLATMA